MEIRQRRRAPDIGLAGDPGLRPLRRIEMPRPRLEITKLFVEYLIELAKEFDDLIVRIAVIGGDIVPRAVAQRAPDDRDALLPEQVAGILQMNEVLQFEGHVMHFAIGAADEIHRMMIRVAAHEDEKVVDPVGDLKSEDLAVKLRGLLRIFDHPRDVAELERPDAMVR